MSARSGRGIHNVQTKVQIDVQTKVQIDVQTKVQIDVQTKVQIDVQTKVQIDVPDTGHVVRVTEGFETPCSRVKTGLPSTLVPPAGTQATNIRRRP